MTQVRRVCGAVLLVSLFAVDGFAEVRAPEFAPIRANSNTNVRLLVPEWGSLPRGNHGPRRVNHHFTITAGEQGEACVDGDCAWRESRFPPPATAMIRTIKKDGAGVVVSLESGFNRYFNLHFPGGVSYSALLGRLVLLDDDQAGIDAYFAWLSERMANRSLGARYWAGAGELTHLVYDLSGEGIEFGTFKDRDYVTLEMGDAGVLYNTLKLDQPGRIAAVLQDRGLTAIRKSAPLAAASGAFGVAMRFLIRSRSFAREYDQPETEALTVYVPMDLASQFAAADITSDEMLAGSVLLLNGNRISPPSAPR